MIKRLSVSRTLVRRPIVFSNNRLMPTLKVKESLSNLMEAMTHPTFLIEQLSTSCLINLNFRRSKQSVCKIKSSLAWSLYWNYWSTRCTPTVPLWLPMLRKSLNMLLSSLWERNPSLVQNSYSEEAAIVRTLLTIMIRARTSHWLGLWRTI